ncbi:MAG: hypothetical protein ABI119_03350 [Gemmatimonadaceae bacterium]
MRIPWYVVAIAFVLAVAAASYGIHEHEVDAALAKVRQHQLDSLHAKSTADSLAIVHADSVAVAQAHTRDSLRAVADTSGHRAEVALASTRDALRRLRDVLASRDTGGVASDSDMAEVERQLTLDSIAIRAGVVALLAADSSARLDSIRIADRDTRIGTLTTALEVALTKAPVPRFATFAEGGVGVSVANGGTVGTGVVVALGERMHLIGPVALVGRGQYSAASHSTTFQMLASYTF